VALQFWLAHIFAAAKNYFTDGKAGISLPLSIVSLQTPFSVSGVHPKSAHAWQSLPY